MTVPHIPIPVPRLGDPAAPVAHGPGTLDAISRDAHAGLALIERQLGLPMRPDGLWPMLALIVLGLALAWPVRIAAIRLVARLIRPSAGGASVLALGEAVATVVITAFCFGFGATLALWGCDTGLFLLPVTRALGETMVAGVAITGFSTGLGHAILAVEDPAHRPFPSLVAPDWVYAFYLPCWGATLGASGLIEKASDLLHASPPSRTLAHGIVLVAEALLIVGFLIAVGRSRDAAISRGNYTPAKVSQSVTAISWGLMLVGVVAFVTGHVAFAVLLFQEMIWSGLVVAFAVLCANAIEGTIDWGTGPDRGLRRFAVHVMGIKPERVTQVGLLVAALLTVLVWLSAISLMIAPLGGGDVVLVDHLRAPALIGDLQHMPVAPTAILLGLGVLIAGVVLTRLLRHWLERRFLPATSLDIGARAAIVTGVGYAAILLVLLGAITAAGINLSKVTLIASALSVGIGFGLQSIIQNFVSGIILLAERPIKVGDWVAVSGAEGSVKRISVRATELFTAEGSVTIVPNSSFISGAVTNRPGEGIAGRMQVSIRIAGLPTAAETRDTVMTLVDGIEGILHSPPPQLLLTDANGDGFGYTLEVYADRRRPMAELRSQLLYALLDGLSNDLKVTIT